MKVSATFSTCRDIVLLLLWGTFILRASASGRLASYLHPSLQPWCLASGLLLLLMALLLIRSLFPTRNSPCSHHDGCCGHDHHGRADHDAEGHSHAHAGSAVPALILKSLLIISPMGIFLTGSTSGYTLSTVQNRGVVGDLAKLPNARPSGAGTTGTIASPSTSTAVPQSSPSVASTIATTNQSSGPMPIQVIDMLYAVQMPSYREEFDGKEIEMTAQYVPMTTGNPRGDRFQAIRMFITCCAADAKPVGVTVRYEDPLSVPEMGWIRITGRPTFPMEGGRRTAVIEATKVEECPAPAEPFVY